MKKIYLTFIAVLSVFQFTYAQWSPSTSGNNIYNTNTGSVGIGTTTPTATLDVNGGIAVKGMVINDSQYISTPSDGTYVVASGNRIKGTYTLTFEAPNRVQTAELIVNASQYDYNSSITVLSNNSYAASVVMSNFRLLFSSDNSTVYLVFDITNRSGGTSVSAHFDGFGFYPPNWGGTLPGSPITQGVCPFAINMGNVLIGRPSPHNSAYILDVNGSVRANQIVVNSTGADFVFEPAYSLLSLSDLKRYIDQNHHLPEIESAKQMQADGVNLGDNQTKLLQKVEELTLYTITADKEIKDEKAIISQLQNQLETQKNQLDLLIKQVTELSKIKN